jgi:hypothetical protein
MTIRRAVYRIGLGIWIGALVVMACGFFAIGTKDFGTVIAYQLAGLVEGFVGSGIFVMADYS